EVAKHAEDTGRAWWTLSQLTTEDAAVQSLGFEAAPGYRGEFERAATDLRAHAASGGAGVVVVAGQGTATRAAEQLSEAEVPTTVAIDGLAEQPQRGLITVTRGELAEGFVSTQLDLVVLSESDLTG